MAQRRMFSKDITEHDAFLEMPLSSQALYFHLGMQADDDGFVSPNRIMRMIGGQIDDLRILIGKKYVLQFDDGVVVIKHWKLNNYLRNDRYKMTAHKDKLSQLSVKNNGSYTWYTNGIPLVDAGKDSIGKDTISEQSSVNRNNLEDMAWKKYNENDHSDEEVTIDDETGDFVENEEEKIAAETRKKNAEMRKYIKGLRDSLNLPSLDPKQMNWQLKDYRILLERGWSHKNIGEAFIHIATSDLWKEKMQHGEYPGMNTVEFSLRNKSPK